jgi:hypothetical protein
METGKKPVQGLFANFPGGEFLQGNIGFFTVPRQGWGRKNHKTN